MQPTDVTAKLKELSTSYLAYKNFAPFVHAGFDACRFLLQLEDCFSAIQKVVRLIYHPPLTKASISLLGNKV